MSDLPSGTVTFLFTDIEGSTALWERDPTVMRAAVDRHFALLRDAVTAHDGVVFKTVGDALHAAFGSAAGAIAAALAAQQALHAEPWALSEPLRVRMALSTGEATPVGGDYAAPVLNRLARLLAVAHGGQILLSAATHQLVHDALPSGTELHDHGEHRLRDLQPVRVYQVVAPDLPKAFPPLRTLDAYPNNLPLPLTDFIGREQEIALVQDLLREEAVRLVTLTGPGGVGKTRLVVRAAADLADTFPDGLLFVALAPVHDARLVDTTIAGVLGVREEGAVPLRQRLAAFLRERRLLLILDNFEHLLEAAALVGELLTAAPGLTVVATSRIRLRLRGEHEVVVSPLPTPDVDHPPTTPEDVATYAAARLFVARAQEAQPGFTLTAENAAVVVAICARLDGLPLALELAAARVKLLPLPALLSRLEHRLPLLTGGARDLPARQQTLRATIGWSYDLLTAQEQGLFRRMAVFAGGWTLEAAEAVTTTEGELGFDTLEGLGVLVDASLVQPVNVPEGEPRFRMLATVREYGLERLEESSEGETARQRHAEYFAALAETIGTHAAWQPDPVTAFTRLDDDLGNLRAALDWTFARGEAATLMRLAVGLRWYWAFHLGGNEGLIWLDRAVAVAEVAPHALRAAVLIAAGWVRWLTGDHRRAEALGTHGRALFREVGDAVGESEALYLLGLVAQTKEDYPEARAQFEEALLRLRPLDEPVRTAWTLRQVGWSAYFCGEHAAGEHYLEEAMALAQREGADHTVAYVLSSLGDIALQQGQYARAAILWQERLNLTWDVSSLPRSVEMLGRIAGALGEAERAARLLGAAEALRERLGTILPPGQLPTHERTVATIRSALDTDAFASAWAEGRRMTRDEAREEAAKVTHGAQDPPRVRAMTGAARTAARSAPVAPRPVTTRAGSR